MPDIKVLGPFKDYYNTLNKLLQDCRSKSVGVKIGISFSITVEILYI